MQGSKSGKLDKAAAKRLRLLEARIRRDFELLKLDQFNTDPPDAGSMLDVTIIGAGEFGIAAAYALKRAGITNIAIYDMAEPGKEGPWITYARMQTLRSPKDLPGLALGVPSLTFRSWFEARFSRRAWQDLKKIPPAVWMDYLVWLRTVLRLPVVNSATALRISSAQDGSLSVLLKIGGRKIRVRTRKVVLAIGRRGLFAPRIQWGVERMPQHLWAHADSAISPDQLRSKTVAVIGSGATAIDNASFALRSGARIVHLLIRREEIQKYNRLEAIDETSFYEIFYELPDRWKWRILTLAEKAGVPPPRESILALRDRRANFHLGCRVRKVVPVDKGIRLVTNRGTLDVDFLILATGHTLDLTRGALIREFVPDIVLWKHRFADWEDAAEFGSWPYLGAGFQFLSRTGKMALQLENIHCFNHGALISHGESASTIPGMEYGALRLAQEILRTFCSRQGHDLFERVKNYSKAEITIADYEQGIGSGFPRIASRTGPTR